MRRRQRLTEEAALEAVTAREIKEREAEPYREPPPDYMDDAVSVSQVSHLSDYSQDELPDYSPAVDAPAEEPLTQTSDLVLLG